MALDPVTKKCLLGLKKNGRPCNFVMVQKGPDVLALVAYWKGALESKKADARKLAKGELSWGVIDGKSLNVTFKLLRSDGFESPPVQESKLKKFLNDDNGQAFRAKIEIVDELPEVSEDDDDQTPLVPPRPPQQMAYRSAEEWRAVLEQVQSENDPQTRAQLVSQLARDWLAENNAVKQALENDPDSDEAQLQSEILRKVGNIVKVLTQSGGQQPPPPQTPPPQTPPPQPPQQQGPSPARQKLTQVQEEREAIIADTKKRVEQVAVVRDLYSSDDMNALLADCQTRDGSDFGRIALLMYHQVEGQKCDDGSLHDQVVGDLRQARELAQKYIDEHKNPRIGRLKGRVKKRREACQKFLSEITQQLDDIETKNASVAALCKSYRDRLQGGGFVPLSAGEELKKLLQHPLLSDNTKELIKITLDFLQDELKKIGYRELAKHPQIGEQDKAELLEAYGCYKGAGGGTSDVKLLQNDDGSIAFAFKGAAKESLRGLDYLDLDPGACAMREDISSTLCQELLRQTQLDLGFPQAKVSVVNGTTGALVNGIRGGMADPEELAGIYDELLQAETLVGNLRKTGVTGPELIKAEAEYDRLQKKYDELKDAIETLPDQISQESLTNVILSTVLTCQWDCKWGNMIVEGNTARPIDGGTAIPTKHVVEELVGNWRGAFPPQLNALLKYPEKHSKQGQTLPTAQLPMPKQQVDAILKLNVDDLIGAGQSRRDGLLQDHPGLNTQDPLMDDSCFDIVRASIEAAQNILRSTPQITLEQFAAEYEKWFLAWGAKFVQG